MIRTLLKIFSLMRKVLTSKWTLIYQISSWVHIISVGITKKKKKDFMEFQSNTEIISLNKKALTFKRTLPYQSLFVRGRWVRLQGDKM